MSGELKRLSLTICTCEIGPHMQWEEKDDGEFVYYDDHKAVEDALRAEVEELKRKNALLRAVAEGYVRMCREQATTCKCLMPLVEEARKGGAM